VREKKKCEGRKNGNQGNWEIFRCRRQEDLNSHLLWYIGNSLGEEGDEDEDISRQRGDIKGRTGRGSGWWVVDGKAGRSTSRAAARINGVISINTKQPSGGLG